MTIRYEKTPETPAAWHPYANLFPWIDGAAREEFKADIRKNGVIEPIVMYEGMILDGRNRYEVARDLGIEYPITDYIGDDPLGFVIAKNLTRRHLTESQRAMVAADIGKLDRGGLRGKGSIDPLSAEQRAELTGVGRASVVRADAVKEHGIPEVAAAVKQGDMAVSMAADIAKLPHDEQRKLIEAADPKVLRAVIKEKRADVQAEKKERRVTRERELAGNIVALPEKKYGVIYADPEWKFQVYSDNTGQDRAAGNHYPTSPTDEICARPVADIAAKDCVLFLCATAPMLPDALRVMEAWGFKYKSHLVWRKPHVGTGYWFRNGHELLLVGTRGKIPAPAPGTQFDSIINAPTTEHSEKPDRFYEIIEAYFPNLPKIELNARRRREGWSAWGNEAPDDQFGSAA